MNVDSTVGRETFFSCLGIALTNIGYHRVTPVFKKGRRLGYKGLAFKANGSSFQSDTPTHATAAKNTQGTLNIEMVQQWMERCYCEGGKDDLIAKDEIWLNFKKDSQMEDDNRSTFFTLLGKCVFNHPPFSKVRRLKKEGKVSLYQHLRNRSLEEPPAQAVNEVDLLDNLVEESTPNFDGNETPQSRTSETSDGDNGIVEHPSHPERGDDLESDTSEKSEEDHGLVRQHAKKKEKLILMMKKLL